jgi:hypothetical protein
MGCPRVVMSRDGNRYAMNAAWWWEHAARLKVMEEHEPAENSRLMGDTYASMAREEIQQ